MARSLAEHGVNFAFGTLPEIRDRAKAAAGRHARRRKAAGAELRGPAYMMNALVCYFLELSPQEQARVVDAGRAIFDRHLAADEEPDPSGPAPRPGGNPSSVPADEVSRRPAIGIGGGHVEHVDRQGDDQPPERRRPPKRRP